MIKFGLRVLGKKTTEVELRPPDLQHTRTREAHVSVVTPAQMAWSGGSQASRWKVTVSLCDEGVPCGELL